MHLHPNVNIVEFPSYASIIVTRNGLKQAQNPLHFSEPFWLFSDCPDGAAEIAGGPSGSIAISREADNESGGIFLEAWSLSVSLGQFTRDYTQTVKRAADNKRRYAPGKGHSAVLLWGYPKGA